MNLYSKIIVGRILKPSSAYPGSIHDYNVRQSEPPPILKNATILAEKGYQVLQK